jgi:hypothetical protein
VTLKHPPPLSPVSNRAVGHAANWVEVMVSQVQWGACRLPFRQAMSAELGWGASVGWDGKTATCRHWISLSSQGRFGELGLRCSQKRSLYFCARSLPGGFVRFLKRELDLEARML